MKKDIMKRIFRILILILQIAVFLMYAIPEYFNIQVEYDNFKILIYFIVSIFLSTLIDYDRWNKIFILTRIVFFLTICADYFMTYLNNYYEISLVFFILVQLSYFVIIKMISSQNHIKSSIIIYLSIVSLLVIFAHFTSLINLLNLLSILYYSLSIINIVNLVRIKEKNRYINCFLIGLILFLLCDTCIGLRNIGITNAKFINIISVLIWIFYASSQIILSNTLIEIGIKRGKDEKNY